MTVTYFLNLLLVFNVHVLTVELWDLLEAVLLDPPLPLARVVPHPEQGGVLVQGYHAHIHHGQHWVAIPGDGDTYGTVMGHLSNLTTNSVRL